MQDHRTVWLPGKSPNEANLIDFTSEAVEQAEEEESGEAQLSFLTASPAAAASAPERETERFRELLLYGRKKVRPWACPRAHRERRGDSGGRWLRQGLMSGKHRHVREELCAPSRHLSDGVTAVSPPRAGVPALQAVSRRAAGNALAEPGLGPACAAVSGTHACTGRADPVVTVTVPGGSGPLECSGSWREPVPSGNGSPWCVQRPAGAGGRPGATAGVGAVEARPGCGERRGGSRAEAWRAPVCRGRLRLRGSGGRGLAGRVSVAALRRGNSGPAEAVRVVPRGIGGREALPRLGDRALEPGDGCGRRFPGPRWEGFSGGGALPPCQPLLMGLLAVALQAAGRRGECAAAWVGTVGAHARF